MFRVCPQCGTGFNTWPSHNKIFCSYKCSGRGRRNSIYDVLSRLDITDGNSCWIWTGGKCNGYGSTTLKSKSYLVHIIVYEYFMGPVPEGLDLHHKCENSLCANPNHLESLTRKDHIHKGNSPFAVNARKTHCIHGHEFTFSNTYVTPDGRRQCVECKNKHSRDYNERKNILPQFREKAKSRVDAIQFQFEAILTGEDGEQAVANIGDWVVTDATGSQFIMSDVEFGEMYEPIKKPGRKTSASANGTSKVTDVPDYADEAEEVVLEV